MRDGLIISIFLFLAFEIPAVGEKCFFIFFFFFFVFIFFFSVPIDYTDVRVDTNCRVYYVN